MYICVFYIGTCIYICYDIVYFYGLCKIFFPFAQRSEALSCDPSALLASLPQQRRSIDAMRQRVRQAFDSSQSHTSTYTCILYTLFHLFISMLLIVIAIIDFKLDLNIR